MRKRLAVLLVGVFLLGACAESGEPPAPEAGQAEEASGAEEQPGTEEAPEADDGVATDPASLSVEDHRGSSIELEEPAARIACLTGICVDSLFLLDVMPVAANDVLHFSPDYFGPDADIAPIEGAFFEPSIEDIVAAEPDLVIGLAGVHEGIETALDPIPLMIVDPVGVEGAKDTLERISTLVDRQDQAAEAIAHFEQRLEAGMADIEEPRSSIMIWSFDGASVGAEFLFSPSAALLDEISEYVYRVEVEDGDFPDFTLEELLDLDPDVIFASVVTFGAPAVPLAEQLADDPIWSQLSAVESGDVYDVPFDLWSAARGLRSLELILDEAMTHIY